MMQIGTVPFIDLQMIGTSSFCLRIGRDIGHNWQVSSYSLYPYINLMSAYFYSIINMLHITPLSYNANLQLDKIDLLIFMYLHYVHQIRVIF